MSGDLLVSQRGWARFEGERFPCAVGRGGFTARKREGDGAAPFGAFRFEEIWFRPDRLRPPAGARLPLRATRRADGWSDDAEDPAYNRAVRLPHPWRCERMWRGDALYDLVLVFDANRAPIRPGAGSALFVHVWRGPRRPTEGCVALPRARLLALATRIGPRTRLVLRA